MIIKVNNLDSNEIVNLLNQHLNDMHNHSPVGSVHALDLESLKATDITVWSVHQQTLDGTKLAGCGALKELNFKHGEIKSMRTVKQFLRMGVAAKMLQHIISCANKRNYHQLSLETGSAKSFLPAKRLYEKHGFVECPPFANYQLDPNSIFMTLCL